MIYCDALFPSVKRGNSYIQEALHIIYGVKEDNTRAVLLLEVNPTESSAVWEEYLTKPSEWWGRASGFDCSRWPPWL